MSNLSTMMLERVAAGLQRRSIASCSRWAEVYRRTKEGFWSFKRYPWTREMHDSRAEFSVGQKAAQMGYTETMLNIGFYRNDVLHQDVLYVLPNLAPDASAFSSARFDSALELCPHLEQLYGDARNVGHKRAGTANFYIRGSQSRSGLKSVPVSVVIMDEVEEMDQDNIALAVERTSGQFDKLVWAVSTPTISGHGISKMFQETTQEHFFFCCPSCSQRVELTYPECLVIVGDDPGSSRMLEESHLICPSCRSMLPHGSKQEWLAGGEWVPLVRDKIRRGFHISQLYSTTVTPGHLAIAATLARSSPVEEQEFYNSKLGIPHEAEGARITNAQVDACIRDYLGGGEASRSRIVTMGVDVGKRVHFEVDEWDVGEAQGSDVNTNAACRVVEIGALAGTDAIEQLDALMVKHGVHVCVIDAHPDRRSAFQFSQRFWGHVKMCIYGRGVAGKQVHEHKSDDGEPLITVDRTSWLDQSLGRFRAETISLPRDVPFEYRNHLLVMARVWHRDSSGNPVGTYVTENNRADHFAHARNYAEIALAMATTIMSAQDVEVVL